MSRFPAEKKISRKAPSRDVLVNVYIVSEGRVTEVKYIQSYQKTLECRLYNEIFSHPGGPKSIAEFCVNKVAELRKSRDRYVKKDQVWAVFDVDNHHDITNQVQKIRAAGVDVFVSNPCIEVWGLLHASTQDKPMSTIEAQKKLRDIMPGYHHDNNPVFNFQWCTEKGINQAMKNAMAGRIARRNDYLVFSNDSPSTGFDRLLRKLAGKELLDGDLELHPELFS